MENIKILQVSSTAWQPTASQSKESDGYTRAKKVDRAKRMDLRWVECKNNGDTFSHISVTNHMK